jgi:fructose-1,6-bisphosphatase/sedoheptulose 1,7-bisphosphatase-like protein
VGAVREAGATAQVNGVVAIEEGEKNDAFVLFSGPRAVPGRGPEADRPLTANSLRGVRCHSGRATTCSPVMDGPAGTNRLIGTSHRRVALT